MSRIAVFDLEYTAWEGSMQRHWSEPWEEREVVQIGAVKLDEIDGLQEITTLELLVIPRINPELSDYFVDLTGITRERVTAEGTDLTDALSRFATFIGDCRQTCCLGRDENILRHNCELYDVPFPFDDGAFVNVRPAVVDYLDGKGDGVISSTLPDFLGFPRPGDSHDAIADSRCTAEALRILRRAGAF